MTKTDQVCPAPWSSHSPGGRQTLNNKTTKLWFRAVVSAMKTKKAEKGCQGGWAGDCFREDLQCRWHLTRLLKELRKWTSWSSDRRETTKDKNWEQHELRVFQEAGAVAPAGSGGWWGVRLIAETLLAMVSFAFIPSVTGSHWQEREAIWLRFYSRRNISKEILTCSTEGLNLLVAKNADTCKWIRKQSERPPSRSGTVALLDIRILEFHTAIKKNWVTSISNFDLERC